MNDRSVKGELFGVETSKRYEGKRRGEVESEYHQSTLYTCMKIE
jgi:hypothetical protein